VSTEDHKESQKIKSLQKIRDLCVIIKDKEKCVSTEDEDCTCVGVCVRDLCVVITRRIKTGCVWVYV